VQGVKRDEYCLVGLQNKLN